MRPRRRTRAQGQIEFAIGIAVVIVFAAIGLDQLRGAVYFYFTGEGMNVALSAPPPGATATPTPTATVGSGPTSTPTLGPSPTPTATAIPTSVTARTPNIQILCAPIDPIPLAGDTLAIIDSNQLITCIARVSDPLNLVDPLGTVTFGTSADGNDQNLGIGNFYASAAPGTSPLPDRAAAPCTLIPRGGGVSDCTMYYMAIFSGRPESTSPYMLRRHQLRATYDPIAVPLISRASSIEFRVRRVAFVVMALNATNCGSPWPRFLPTRTGIVCTPQVIDRDTGAAPPISGTIQWSIDTGPDIGLNQLTRTNGVTQSAVCSLGPTAECVPGQQVMFTPSTVGSYGIQLRFLPDAGDRLHSEGTREGGRAQFDIMDTTASTMTACDNMTLSVSGTPNSAICRVEIANTSGTAAPNAGGTNVTWTVTGGTPGSLVVGGACSGPPSVGNTSYRCVMFTPIAPGDYQLHATYQDANGLFGPSTTDAMVPPFPLVHVDP